MRNRLRTLLFCTVVTMAWSDAGILAAPPVTRSYAAGYFVLELDGVQVGFVSGVEGGLAFSDVIKVPGEDYFFKKHLANPGYRDIRLELGAGMDKSVYAWIGTALQGQGEPMNGALLALDLNLNVRSRLEFTHALITEVTFPAADANSKDPVRILIGLTPQYTQLNRSPGKTTAKVALTKTQRILGGNFRLSIDGLNLTKVSKVEALTVKIPLTGGGPGECRLCEDIPAGNERLDFPNVVMTLSEANAQSVHEWFEDFVIAGNSDDAKEKGGTLEFLTPDLASTVFKIKFNHLGIFELMPVIDAQSNSIPRLMAAMYCESMEFTAQ